MCWFSQCKKYKHLFSLGDLEIFNQRKSHCETSGVSLWWRRERIFFFFTTVESQRCISNFFKENWHCCNSLVAAHADSVAASTSKSCYIFLALLMKHALPMPEILSSEFERKVFLTIQPDWPDRPREEETRNKSHANPACFKAAPGWCPITGQGKGQMRLRLPNNVRSETLGSSCCTRRADRESGLQLDEERRTLCL